MRKRNHPAKVANSPARRDWQRVFEPGLPPLQHRARASVVLPVHNGEGTIGRAIESVLNQDLSDIEIITVDDGSTDSTFSELCRYRERVRIARRRRQGPAHARNFGASIATGEYLAFLDADDAWRPGFLSRLLGALENAPDASMAFSNIEPVNDAGQPAPGFGCSQSSAPTLDELLTRWVPILTSAVVIRKSAFDACGGFDQRFTKPGYEDPWLWLRLRELGEFSFVDEPLVVYRISPELDRMERYRSGFRIFSKLVRNRYGAAGERLVANCREAHVSVLSYRGLISMRIGDAAQARRYFSCAWRYDRNWLRNALRFARTFLPFPIAMRLTGRTRFICQSTAEESNLLSGPAPAAIDP